MFRRQGKVFGAVTGVTAIALACAACGSSSGSKSASGSGGSSAGMTNITLAGLPIIDAADAYIAKQNGFFKKEHLNVNIHTFAAGPAAVAAVQSGAAQFGSSNNFSTIQGAVRGLKVKAVAGENEPYHDTAVCSGKNSSITSISQLAGQSIGSPIPGGPSSSFIAQVVDNALAKQGVDTSAIKYITMPTATAAQQIDSGQIKAAWCAEPVLSQVLNSGGHLLSWIFPYMGTNYLTGDWLASDSYIQSHPTVVKEFVTALYAAQRWANENPARTRAVLPLYTSIPKNLLSTVRVPKWSTQLTAAQLKPTIASMIKYKMIPAAQAPSPSAVIHNP